jgi:nitrate/nitrite-specific signal transduction histidine kinase
MTVVTQLTNALKSHLPEINVSTCTLSKEDPGQTVAFSLDNFSDSPDTTLVDSTLTDLLATTLAYELKSYDSNQLLLVEDKPVELKHTDKYSTITCTYRVD